MGPSVYSGKKCASLIRSHVVTSDSSALKKEVKHCKHGLLWSLVLASNTRHEKTLQSTLTLHSRNWMKGNFQRNPAASMV